ncbi:hypothetical protein SAMD00019534_026460 [Acytostelium subglobosum LB1]|uniref:hypothetical protein n=1 Tax=Acytostelium subglobosum LB1 TaxID=1410327 RepID=UPI000644A906|nr:hypothetical protein SAMD00019534_026460 [Acytostelium subglobosum LB1]GAM19471.1 hypothetical protein SAMD00019534_026460 [Acytostelium subglobosum LB1]|eukprot:XP_012757398.1 hypothetical protein SAMD00019534_026460 [Acytostelium subglobosum LB1]
MSLVCKRLFDQRQSYLSFNLDRLPPRDYYNEDNVTLNSYKQIINNNIDCKSQSVLVYTDDDGVIDMDYDCGYYIDSALSDNESWKQEVLGLVMVDHIHFRDCKDNAFDETFWNGVIGLLDTLRARYPSIIITASLTYMTQSMRDVPLTELSVEEDQPGDINIIQTYQYPPTLTKLMISRLYWVDPRLDLTGLTSLKILQLPSLAGKPLDGSKLPSSLTDLTLTYTFNQTVSNLPPSVTNLRVLCVSNSHPINHHPTLRTLQRGKTFNMVFSSPSLPFTLLTTLRLGTIEINDFKSIDWTLMPMLTTLSMYLTTSDTTTLINLSALPSSIKRMEVTPCAPIESFPDGLEYLHISFDRCSFKLVSTMWPGGIQASHIHTLSTYYYIHPLCRADLPASITTLKLFGSKCLNLDPTEYPPLLRKVEGTGRHSGHLLQTLSASPIQQMELCMDNGEGVALRRISSNIFMRIDERLVRSGFIHIDRLQTLYAEDRMM